MADPVYEIPDNPEYNTSIRKLQNSDPANADQIFNPLIDALIGNTHFVKLMTDALKTKLDGIEPGAQKNAVTSVAGKTGAVTISKADVGLGNVDNTADNSKNVASAVKLTTARNIDGISFDGSGNISHFGICSTTGATAAKTVAITGFNLITGARAAVRFTYTNTASSPTLNVNGTGAVPMYYKGSQITSTYPYVQYLRAGCIYEFIYNGSEFELAADSVSADNHNESSTAAGVQGITYPFTYVSGAEVDLNSYTEQGDYAFYNVGAATNFPSAGTWTGASYSSFLEVRKLYAGTIRLQRLFQRQIDRFFIRYSTSATAWSAWQQVAFTDSSITGNAGTATALQTSRSIDGVNFNGSAAIVHSGVCTTLAATSTKTVSITGFALADGAEVRVRFANTNTAASPALNVTSTGAKEIWYKGTRLTSASPYYQALKAGGIYHFRYNASALASDGETAGIWEIAGDLSEGHTHDDLPLSGGAMTGTLTAYNNTSYSTPQVRNISAGTADLTAGTSSLASGSIYLVYE